MDRGFCVLKEQLETRKRGVYGSALIKKRCYWSMGVYGYTIDDYFRSKYIGDVGYLSGEWEETEFNIFVLKDTDYNIMMMSNFWV